MTNKFIYKTSLCCFYMLVSIHWMNSANAMEEDEKMYHSFMQNKQKNESNKQQNNMHKKEEEKTVSPPQTSSQKNIQQGWNTMSKGVEGGRVGYGMVNDGFNMIEERVKAGLPVPTNSLGGKYAEAKIATGAAITVVSDAAVIAGATQYIVGKGQQAWEWYSSEPSKK